MQGEVAADRPRMLALMRRLGFALVPHHDDPGLRVAELPLRAAG